MVLGIQEEGTPLRVNKSFPQAQILFPARSRPAVAVREGRPRVALAGKDRIYLAPVPLGHQLKRHFILLKEPCLVSFGERGPSWAWIWEQDQVPVCPRTIPSVRACVDSRVVMCKPCFSFLVLGVNESMSLLYKVCLSQGNYSSYWKEWSYL